METKISFSLIICELVIQKKPVINKNLNRKVEFMILIVAPTTVVQQFLAIYKVWFLVGFRIKSKLLLINIPAPLSKIYMNKWISLL